MRIRTLLLAATLAAVSLAVVPTAEAAGRVGVTNEFGKAQADRTYATRLTLRGRGFQSVKNGHGGIYVFFGTVKGTWQPSRGGSTGTNYLYVPDAESQSNQGYQQFIAFPGSDTAGSANGVVRADGSWTAKITVPGARFNAVDRDGKAVGVDCTKVTCGVITIGAHGVKNARNESFTPVDFAQVYDTAPTTTSPTAAPTTSPTAAATGAPRASGPATAPVPAGEPTAGVDHDTAVVGRVLSFSGAGFQPGEQVTASFDHGRAAVGPLPAGASGEVAGVLQLPAATRPGTHTLRLVGAASGTKVDVNFPVAAGANAPVASGAGESADPGGPPTWAGWTFLGAAVVLLLGAAFLAVRGFRGLRTTRQGVAGAS